MTQPPPSLPKHGLSKPMLLGLLVTQIAAMALAVVGFAMSPPPRPWLIAVPLACGTYGAWIAWSAYRRIR